MSEFEHRFETFEKIEERGCLHCNNYLSRGFYKIKDLPNGKVLWGNRIYCKVKECRPDFTGRCRICRGRLISKFEKKQGICWACVEKQEEKEKALETIRAIKKLVEVVSKLESLNKYEGKVLIEKFKQYVFAFRAIGKRKGEFVITTLEVLPSSLRTYMRKRWEIYREKCDGKLCRKFKSCVVCVVEQALEQIKTLVSRSSP